MSIIEKMLFEKEAIKIAPEYKPFWYTSGKIGPYFINTHYLFGGEKKTNELLIFIDKNIEKDDFTEELTDKIVSFLNTDQLFKEVVIEFYNNIKENSKFKESNYISGGERRDWFFSIPVAYLANKKHLFIFKNLKVKEIKNEITDLNNEKITHISDLINQASSYEKYWIPAIKKLNAKLIFTATIVDRNQGGKDFLLKKNIDLYSAVLINDKFFDLAVKNNIINIAQLELIKEFNKSPDLYGKNFILNNIDFLIESLKSENKTIKIKAEKCIKENPYKIDFEKIL